MSGEQGGRRWSILPRLLARAPARVLIAAGVLITALGILIVARPLTSLLLLGVYVGVSAIISGVLDLLRPRPTPRWWTEAFAFAWVVAGVLILVWIGRSLNLLPGVLAILLLLGGLSSLGDAATRRPREEGDRTSTRVLTAVWGLSQLAFGLLSLTWPDVTVLVVAVVFGLRTAVFGLMLFWRGILTLTAREDRGGWGTHRALRSRRRLTDAGRYALVVVLVAATGVGWSLNGWLQDGAPVIDAFYDPPSVVPREHGALIRVDDYTGTAPTGAVVKRILYTTTDAHGQPATASGLVIIPDIAVPAPLPVVLWNHGTTGVARGCAPSMRSDAATRWAIPAVDEAVAKGWIVVAPDYSGQGAPGVFPYLIGQGEARSGLDAVLAIRHLPHLWASDQVTVWGHSQGGHAALWTSQLAAAYTPDLDVLGTAALAPAADPLSLARDLTAGYASPELTVLTAWVLVPYSQTYPDVRVDDYVSPGTRAIVREMAQRCPTEPGLVVSVLTALGVSENSPLYIGDLTTGALGYRLGQNSARGVWHTPLLIDWGTDDEVIPRSEQVALVERLCKAENTVEWHEYPDLHHQDILQPGSAALPRLVSWTEDLFSPTSKPAPVPATSCR